MYLARKQMMMKLLFPLLSLLITSLTIMIPSCKAQTDSPLSGQIEMHPDWKPFVYLVKPRHFNEIAADYLGQVIDSAAIAADGKFQFPTVLISDEQILVELVVQKKESKFASHLSDEDPNESNYMPLVLNRNKSVAIKSRITNFQKTFLIDQPSADNSTILSLRDVRLSGYAKLTSETGEDSDADSLIIEKEEAYNRYTKVIRDFADTTGSLYAAMVAIRWVSPTGDFERTPEFLHGQCKKWQKAQPENLFTAELCIAANEENLPVMVGDVMPDYKLPLVNGDSMMLLAMLGNRLTLVDIWASWCAPCRKENREILGPLWSTYKSKGLQIIAYALDSNEASWKSAIKKDGATWIQASHLTGDDSPFLKSLRITTIPANYLLDVNGKVLAKNVFGPELQNLVTEYLK
jgi:thiol-disulfide isomerase/thioredoxin